MVSGELGRDKAIIEQLPQDEAMLTMFQLSKFDRPLILSRRLMAQHYGGETPPEEMEEAACERDLAEETRERGAALAAIPLVEERRA